MKLFDITQQQFERDPQYKNLTGQASSLIIAICKKLNLNLESCHYSLFVFHCNAVILTFQRFDRFLYTCAAVLVGSKLGQNLVKIEVIVKQCRAQLRKMKGMVDEQDTLETIQRIRKRVLEAQLNIMINIGFDFDIHLAINLTSWLKKQIKNEDDLVNKVTHSLTSLYRTQVVIFYPPKLLLITALDIVLKNEGINVALADFSQELVQALLLPSIRDVKKEYLKRTPVD